MSGAILLLGVLGVIALWMAEGSRETVRAARRIRVGDDTSSVLMALGAPGARCSAGDLAHLAATFPAGTPRPTAEETMQRLRQGTAARWVWGRRSTCAPRPGQTEVGFTRDGRVFWAVAEHGGGPATLP